MNELPRNVGVLVLALLVIAVGAVFALQTNPQPVHVEQFSCVTGTGVSCDVMVVNTNNETGYYLALQVIGYDADGNAVTRYTNDGTSGGGGIVDISSGAVENMSISTSSPEPVADADVRIVDVEPIER